MATVSEPRGTFDPGLNRRVRHPLNALRGHIRRYVLLEGLTIAVLYLALCFWAGLALDYGLFRLFAFDWVQELQQLAVTSGSGDASDLDTVIRVSMLSLFLGGLLATVIWKVLLRITREFTEPALALVLERRFPGVLGDRLITAVEMADPQLADRYSFSKALIEHTIEDAAARVEKVPVTEVFNWGRLRRLGTWCVLVTLGMYGAAGVGSCAYGAFFGGAASPGAFFSNFNDAAGIWIERNILLMNSYWPRRAYLEVIRFQDTEAHPGEMRVGRDEQRPDVQIRAIQWVIADRQSPDGWRALHWDDLPQFLDPRVLAEVAIPEAWGGWFVDLDDLDRTIPAGVLPSSWKGKTVAEARADLAQPTLRENVNKAGAEEATRRLLDWRSWTLDKIQLQEQKDEVRRALRAEYPQAHRALEEIFDGIAVLAESTRYTRTLRRLTIPERIHVYFRGDSKKSDRSHTLQADNKYSVGLNDLTESGRFTARGEDYFTPYKKITLVPPPSIQRLTVDKEEPAYIYYRVQGDQNALKGKKQFFYGYTISSQDEASNIYVPLGTNMVLHARTDRPFKDGIRMRPPAQPGDRASAVPEAPVLLDADGMHFAMSLPNVVKPYEFVFEFNDRDNVKGKRRLRIQPIDDRPPEILDFELDVVLRKPRLKADPGKGSAGLDGFLITPDALLPFKGTLRDDYGLTRASWVHEAEQREFELVGQGTSVTENVDKLPKPALQGSSQVRREALALCYFQVTPGMPSLEILGPAHWSFMARFFRAASVQKRSEGEQRVPLEGFQHVLERRSIDELSLSALDQIITDHAGEQKRKQQAQDEKRKYVADKRLEGRPPLKEHSLKDEEGFDLKRYVPRLKVLDPRKEGQLHYQVTIFVEAADNNVETGPGMGRNRAPFTFLVVSENELLGQIAIEEEVLRDRLDKAAFKLRNAKTTMDEQIGKLAAPGSDYTLISIRVDDIRKALLDAGTASREVYNDYRRILKELEVNRVKRAKTDDVRDKIVFPLGEIVDPNVGNFTAAEAAVEKLYQGLDDDVAQKKGEANRVLHLDNAKVAGERLNRLLQRLSEILIAMDEGVVESKLLELIVNIERDQRQIAERARNVHNRKVEELLEGLTK